MPRRYEITDKHRSMFAELLKTGNDPVSFFCNVLSDEKASEEQRGGRQHVNSCPTTTPASPKWERCSAASPSERPLLG
jgi:hypothetical protein